MATIIRTTDSGCTRRGEAFNFADLTAQAESYLAKVRADGAAMVSQARSEAAAVRQQAEVEGLESAHRNVETMLEKQLAPVLPAIHQAVVEIRDAKQAWLARWEAGAVKLATAIAERLIRRELEKRPEITLDLVRESLELAAGSSHICLRLNPADHKTLGQQIRKLAKEMSQLGEVEIQADSGISPGGCRVDTSFGAIDQQFESQLKRIEEELLQ